MRENIPPADTDQSHDDYLHDIRSHFTVILGTTQILERRIRAGHAIEPEQMLTMLARIRTHSEAAHGVVHAFGLFHWHRRHRSVE